MDRREFIAARAEGLALAIFGIAACMSDPGMRADQTISDIAGWLNVNGGDAFVLKLAKAIEAEKAVQS